MKTVWRMKDTSDKAKGKPKSAQGSGEDSDKEEVKTPKKKKQKEATLDEVVRLLKEQGGKLKEQGGKLKALEQGGKKYGDKKKKKGVCFLFRDKGSCKFGEKCGFEHVKEDSEEKPRRGRLPDPPEDACATLKRTGKCGDKHCAAKHGKWNKSGQPCRREENGECCKFLFLERGCDFDHSKIKNGE